MDQPGKTSVGLESGIIMPSSTSFKKKIVAYKEIISIKRIFTYLWAILIVLFLNFLDIIRPGLYKKIYVWFNFVKYQLSKFIFMRTIPSGHRQSPI